MENLKPLALGLAFSAGIVLLTAGCNRQEAISANTPAPATTTVGTDIDDTVLTTKVKSALLSDQELKSFDIKVETRKDLVLLSGFIDSLVRAERAILVARGVDGVKGVENRMTIKEGGTTVGNKVDDSIVTTKVKSALLSDPEVKSIDIAVVTRKGEVQLSGFVDNQAQIDRALVATRAVEGVQGVVNEMSIKK